MFVGPQSQSVAKVYLQKAASQVASFVHKEADSPGLLVHSSWKESSSDRDRKATIEAVNVILKISFNDKLKRERDRERKKGEGRNAREVDSAIANEEVFEKLKTPRMKLLASERRHVSWLPQNCMQNRVGDIARHRRDRDPLTNKEDEVDSRGETKEKRRKRRKPGESRVRAARLR
ncbi:hypothetical protein G5I_12734 [Acromyrmex echinatior]|uniref:Uncharacterized protein n=1 Tax=Acromyrmex echinatior TaxID=103372 RepID=F4X343_ACREC|nr:hypothetical protein G5I_12734 [Acromyrmex echinatior]